jgi:hypothetical protein
MTGVATISGDWLDAIQYICSPIILLTNEEARLRTNPSPPSRAGDLAVFDLKLHDWCCHMQASERPHQSVAQLTVGVWGGRDAGDQRRGSGGYEEYAGIVGTVIFLVWLGLEL